MSLRFSKLDRVGIRQMKDGAKITEHGITVERTAEGDLRWSVNVMVDGRRIHRVIGKESDRVTRTQCEEFIEQARTDARAGRLALPAGRKTALTFSAAADEYVKRAEEGGAKNLTVKRRHLKVRLKPYFGKMGARQISKFTVRNFRKKRLDDGAAPATVNRELATLSHFMRDWSEHEKHQWHPPTIEKFTEGEGRIIVLSDDECVALLKGAIADSDPYCWLFAAFGLNSAMRHGEIVSGRWEYLDVGACRLWIPDAKAGQREQPITAELAAMLLKDRDSREEGKDGGWIFPSLHKDSKVGHRARMDGPFRRAVVAAKLDPAKVTPHVMRHTAITRLVEAGVPLPTVQKISGHKTLSQVLRYTHTRGRHVDEAVKNIGMALPEPDANETGDAATQELHREPLRVVK